jgi:hypothetical protein
MMCADAAGMFFFKKPGNTAPHRLPQKWHVLFALRYINQRKKGEIIYVSLLPDRRWKQRMKS